MPNTTRTESPLPNPVSSTTPVLEVVREYAPLPEGHGAAGVEADGESLWVAGGDRLVRFDIGSGEVKQSLAVQSDAGTAFDGCYLYQVAENEIHKIDPESGEVIARIPTPADGGSGLTWAEGKLWMGQYRDRSIVQLDPETGAVLRTLKSDRFVTGVTFQDGDLWHGTWENDESELRQVNHQTAEVRKRYRFPEGKNVSGLATGGPDIFHCGGGPTGKVRTVRIPKAG